MLERVNEEVTRVPGRMANTYLVEAPKGLILVDTGLPGTEKRITKALAQLGRTAESVKLVLITHRHLDHIGSVSAIKHAFPKAIIASHPFEKPYIAGTLVATVPPAWTFPGRIKRRVMGFATWLTKLLRIIKYKPIYVDKPSDDESILEGTGLDGSILWTPGHTKGSITLFLNKTKTAIVGDLLRGRRGKLVEPSLMESPTQTGASVHRLLDLGPETICPGHGKPAAANKVRLSKRTELPVKETVREKKKEKEEEDVDLDALARDLTV